MCICWFVFLEQLVSIFASWTAGRLFGWLFSYYCFFIVVGWLIGLVGWLALVHSGAGAHFTNNFFHHNSNVMEISFCSHPNTNKVIATIFGTWHDSWAVVACAKFCCDMVTSNWIRAKWNFHRIWIVMDKSLVKWAPGWLLAWQHHDHFTPWFHRTQVQRWPQWLAAGV